MHTYKTTDFIGYNKSYNGFICAEARTLCMHSHEFYEIAYVVQGCGIHYANGVSSLIKEGDFIFVSPGIEHCTISSKDETVPRIRVCNCLFVPEYFNPAINCFLASKFTCATRFNDILSCDSPFCLLMHDTQNSPIKSTILSMKHEMDLQENSIDAIINNHLNTFLIEAGRIYDAQFNLDSIHNHPNPVIQDLISYIKANLDLQLTLNMLAEHVHFSPEYLSRYFKKHTGKNISSFISELRIEKAQELLCHTSYPISEIGYLCGYSSTSNFRKCFSKATGSSPHSFRKKQF